MSGMEGNEHYETGAFAADLVPSNREPNDDATVAVAFATLALAYEQRTANMLKALELCHRAGEPVLRTDPREIASRMGGPGDQP